LDSLPSSRAIEPRNGITLHPEFIKPGQIVMIEINENPATPDPGHPEVLWQFTGQLTDGPVKPCRIVDDPTAFDGVNDTPPPGS
jgi:hypothetical protein